ncbi:MULTISPECIES: DUF3040 domain-containing protein [Paenarthrobacter]|uniref:Multisubunit Na+/H+ antiporter MnhB subunit n=1 Tax=Paenarthrobacter nicotinovorans TaxID=29320 RepID=A0ABT9TQV4_PAENI|nr:MULTISPECIES: DUF3040 domain-containing protein [Paenarthrobacter]MDQ0104058.1 multisubunit Na+/H+ antiporter MnhB subunit [Paenarthrobacter nicotinovorans]
MELSNFEKLELDKIAKGLEEEDPKLAALMSLEDLGRIRWTQAVRGVLVGLAGLGLLLTGVALSEPVLGITGFMVMGGGTFWATLFMDARPGRRKTTASKQRQGKDKETP